MPRKKLIFTEKSIDEPEITQQAPVIQQQQPVEIKQEFTEVKKKQPRKKKEMPEVSDTIPEIQQIPEISLTPPNEIGNTEEPQQKRGRKPKILVAKLQEKPEKSVKMPKSEKTVILPEAELKVSRSKSQPAKKVKGEPKTEVKVEQKTELSLKEFKELEKLRIQKEIEELKKHQAVLKMEQMKEKERMKMEIAQMKHNKEMSQLNHKRAKEIHSSIKTTPAISVAEDYSDDELSETSTEDEEVSSKLEVKKARNLKNKEKELKEQINTYQQRYQQTEAENKKINNTIKGMNTQQLNKLVSDNIPTVVKAVEQYKKPHPTILLAQLGF